MDDAGIGTELVQITGDTVIEASTDSNQYIAFMHGHIGLIGAMHAEHTHKQRVGAGKCPQPHQGVRAGIAQQAYELGERLRAFAHDHTAAGVNHRPLGRENQLDGLLDLPRVSLHHRTVRAHGDRLRIVIAGLLRRDVLGDIHVHRARASGGGDVKGLLHGRRQILDVADEEIVFHTRAREADGIDFLKGVVADQLCGHLAAEHDQRDRIHVRRGNAGDRVGDAGSRGDEHDAGLAGRAGIAIGGVGRALLVADQDMLDLVLLEQGVIDMQRRAARITEDVLDALVLQAAHEQVGTGQFHIHLGQFHDPLQRLKMPGSRASLVTGLIGRRYHSRVTGQ